MSWREDQPQDNDLLKDWSQIMRQRKIDIRSMLSRSFYWNENVSGSSAGIPKAAGSPAGSLRAWSALSSQVSAWRDGSLLVTSDTSNLYTLTSTSSLMIGGRQVAIVDDTSVQQIGAGTRYLFQQSFQRALSAGTTSVTFGSPYNSAPVVLISHEPNAINNLYGGSVSVITTHGFSMCLGYWGTGADPSNATFHWFASGLSNL